MFRLPYIQIELGLWDLHFAFATVLIYIASNNLLADNT